MKSVVQIAWIVKKEGKTLKPVGIALVTTKKIIATQAGYLLS